MLERRTFLTGLISLVAAPAIVRAGSLMPVRVVVEPEMMSGTAIKLMMESYVSRRWITLAEALEMFPDNRVMHDILNG